MLEKILYGLIGIVLFTVCTAVISYLRKGFNLKTMVVENYKYWIATIILVILLIFTIESFPEIAGIIEGYSGVDILKFSGNYVTFGFVFTPLLKAYIKRKEKENENKE